MKVKCQNRTFNLVSMSGITVVSDMQGLRSTVEEMKYHALLFCSCFGKKLGSRYSVLSLMAIATSKCRCFIFDVTKCPDAFNEGGAVAKLLEAKEHKKIFHGCGKASNALSGEFNIELDNVYDTQVAFSVVNYGRELDSYEDISLEDLCEEYELSQDVAQSLSMCGPSYDLTLGQVISTANSVLVLPTLFGELSRYREMWEKRLINHVIEERLSEYKDPSLYEELVSIRESGELL